ncbi:MAG: hypothetical protein EOM50_16340 [Erysipelotrichia bacterium]|nr:hypothetical protein [Erysipelotrichia bacterium]
MIRITDIKLEVSKAPSLAIEKENLIKYIMTQYRINDKDIKSFSIYKKAIDARKKDQIYFVYSVDLEVRNEKLYIDKKMKGLSIAPLLTYQEVPSGENVLSHPPVIVGFGPSGIFAALLLARRGYKPIVLERL